MYDRIRNLRIDNDFTQEYLAKHLNVHQTTYSDYELGNVNIPIPSLIKIALLYGTSADYLIGLTDVPEPYPRAKQYE